MNYHKFFVDNVGKDDVVLDIGCGNGALTYDIARKARRVIGIDLNKRNIEIARSRFARENLEFIYGDALTSLPGENFDVVILSNVLEHIERRIEFLVTLQKRAPKLLIRVPMLNRSWIDLYKKEFGLEYRLSPTHFIEYTLETFTEEMTKAGLRVLNCSIQFGEIWAVVIRGSHGKAQHIKR
jgi:2-polyprenyl-3-methyl-5-hydroxy-6-metoxy-1,4-benzoquinol methylase